MTTYLLIDVMNLFFRAKHMAQRGTIDSRIGLALHITLMSVLKSWQLFHAEHVVFCLEGRSWRKQVYPPYKRNRIAIRAKESSKEAEEGKLFFEAYDDLLKFFEERTNTTVLQNDNVEADDLIARWIQNHPDDQHIIVSTDSDFVQLLDENVRQYNGVSQQIITLDGYFDDQNEPVIDKKTNNTKRISSDVQRDEQPAFALFEKCMRGDTSDNIFSAYPGVRKKGSQKTAGLLEAFKDRNNKGFVWNNMMLQRWLDHDQVEHRVRDDYNRNEILIDLTKQPDDIKESLDETIIDAKQVNRENKQVGLWFMKFCGKHSLLKVAENAHLVEHQRKSV